MVCISIILRLDRDRAASELLAGGTPNDPNRGVFFGVENGMYLPSFFCLGSTVIKNCPVSGLIHQVLGTTYDPSAQV